MTIRIAVLCWSLIGAWTLPAKAEWMQKVSTEYAIGDNESRMVARNGAIDQLKRNAAALAGAYVRSTTTMKNGGEITEHVEVLGASMVRLADISESMQLTERGQLLLRMSATALVDESELARRVASLNTDRVLAKRLSHAEQENRRLRVELGDIRTSLASAATTSQAVPLQVRQAGIFERLDSNAQTVREAFTSGTLARLAREEDLALHDAQAYLQAQFLDPVRHVPLQVGLDGVEAVSSGYVARVRLAWALDIATMARRLAPYLTVQARGSQLYISAQDSRRGHGPHPFSERLFDYLAARPIIAQVRVGNRTASAPIFFHGDDFFHSCNAPGADTGERVSYLCLVNQDFNKASQRGPEGSPDTNPVRVTLTRAEGANATSAAAQVVELFAR